MTRLVSEEDVDLVAESVKEGEIVAFPTETVYGLGVQFNDEEALDALFTAKNRNHDKSITLMVSDCNEIESYAYVNENAKKIIQEFMPGMITLIFKKKDSVSEAMTLGKDTIGIRIPDHPFTLSLLKKAGPMLVTSANLSNHPNTTNEGEVLAQLNHRIDLVVKGSAGSDIASTVVDVTTDEIKILREGIITKRQIEEVL